jgi:hypothetical protein
VRQFHQADGDALALLDLHAEVVTDGRESVPAAENHRVRRAGIPVRLVRHRAVLPQDITAGRLGAELLRRVPQPNARMIGRGDDFGRLRVFAAEQVHAHLHVGLAGADPHVADATYGNERRVAARKPDAIQPPPWGVRSLSYVKDIQPIFDRACHSGNGPAVGKLDLTLRPDPQGTRRWGGILPEPYLTLLMGKDNARIGGSCPGYNADAGYVAIPNTITTRYDTLPPLSCLSPKSRLIAEAMDKSRCGQKLAANDLQMLIAWIDLWAMFRSDDELRAIDDPPAEWFPLWAYPPKCKGAPRVRTEYSQDEYSKPEDRLLSALRHSGRGSRLPPERLWRQGR